MKTLYPYRQASLKRAVALCVGAAMLFTQTAGAFSTENIWSERRRAASRASAAGSSTENLRLARLFDPALPAAASLPAPRPAAAPLPALSPAWLAPLGASGRVLSFSDGKRADLPWIVHVQDAHDSPDAQRRAAEMIEALRVSADLRVVGLEGAEGELSLAPYRDLPAAAVRDAAAGQMLAEGLIGGAEYHGIVSADPAPLRGIEDGALYAANVAALKDILAAEAASSAALAAVRRSASSVRPSEPLRRLADLADRHHRGDLSLRDYAAGLASDGAPPAARYPNLAAFLGAVRAEASLDFARVETERAALLRALSERLDEAALADLVALSLSYRTGQIGHAAFYAALRRFCAERGAGLSAFPRFEKYLDYVLAVEGIDGDVLPDELERFADDRAARLARAEADRAFLSARRALRLSEKLLSQTLTRREWRAYLSAREEAVGLPAALARLGGSPDAVPGWAGALARAEAFYALAERRNEAFVDRLLAAAGGARAPPSGKPAAAVLVSGGFHTRGLVEIFQERGLRHVVAAPRLERAPGGGLETLSFFRGGPRDLEKIFAGERLFLNSPRATASSPAPGYEHLARVAQGYFALLAGLFEGRAGGVEAAAALLEAVERLSPEVGEARLVGDPGTIDGAFHAGFRIDGRALEVLVHPAGDDEAARAARRNGRSPLHAVPLAATGETLEVLDGEPAGWFARAGDMVAAPSVYGLRSWTPIFRLLDLRDPDHLEAARRWVVALLGRSADAGGSLAELYARIHSEPETLLDAGVPWWSLLAKAGPAAVGFREIFAYHRQFWRNLQVVFSEAPPDLPLAEIAKLEFMARKTGVRWGLQGVRFLRTPAEGVPGFDAHRFVTWTADGFALVHEEAVAAWKREGRDVFKTLFLTLLHENHEYVSYADAVREGREPTEEDLRRWHDEADARGFRPENDADLSDVLLALPASAKRSGLSHDDVRRAVDAVEEKWGHDPAVPLAFLEIVRNGNIDDAAIPLIAEFVDTPGFDRMVTRIEAELRGNRLGSNGALGEIYHASRLKRLGFEIVAFSVTVHAGFDRRRDTLVEIDLVIRKDGVFSLVEANHSARETPLGPGEHPTELLIETAQRKLNAEKLARLRLGIAEMRTFREDARVADAVRRPSRRLLRARAALKRYAAHNFPGRAEDAEAFFKQMAGGAPVPVIATITDFAGIVFTPEAERVKRLFAETRLEGGGGGISFQPKLFLFPHHALNRSSQGQEKIRFSAFRAGFPDREFPLPAPGEDVAGAPEDDFEAARAMAEALLRHDRSLHKDIAESLAGRMPGKREPRRSVLVDELLPDLFMPFLSARARALGLKSLVLYAGRFAADEAERDLFAARVRRALRAGKTGDEAFPDAAAWGAGPALAALVARKAASGDRSLHVKTFSVKTGREPYAVAMALRRLLEDHYAAHAAPGVSLEDWLRSWDVQIESYGAHLPALYSAQQGYFNDAAGAPGDYAKLFARNGEKLQADWRLRDWIVPRHLDPDDAGFPETVGRRDADAVFVVGALAGVRSSRRPVLLQAALDGLRADAKGVFVFSINAGGKSPVFALESDPARPGRWENAAAAFRLAEFARKDLLAGRPRAREGAALLCGLLKGPASSSELREALASASNNAAPAVAWALERLGGGAPAAEAFNLRRAGADAVLSAGLFAALTAAALLAPPAAAVLALAAGLFAAWSAWVFVLARAAGRGVVEAGRLPVSSAVLRAEEERLSSAARARVRLLSTAEMAELAGTEDTVAFVRPDVPGTVFLNRGWTADPSNRLRQFILPVVLAHEHAHRRGLRLAFLPPRGAAGSLLNRRLILPLNVLLSKRFFRGHLAANFAMAVRALNGPGEFRREYAASPPRGSTGLPTSGLSRRTFLIGAAAAAMLWTFGDRVRIFTGKAAIDRGVPPGERAERLEKFLEAVRGETQRSAGAEAAFRLANAAELLHALAGLLDELPLLEAEAPGSAARLAPAADFVTFYGQLELEAPAARAAFERLLAGADGASPVLFFAARPGETAAAARRVAGRVAAALLSRGSSAPDRVAADPRLAAVLEDPDFALAFAWTLDHAALRGWFSGGASPGAFAAAARARFGAGWNDVLSRLEAPLARVESGETSVEDIAAELEAVQALAEASGPDAHPLARLLYQRAMARLMLAQFFRDHNVPDAAALREHMLTLTLFVLELDRQAETHLNGLVFHPAKIFLNGAGALHQDLGRVAHEARHQINKLDAVNGHLSLVQGRVKFSIPVPVAKRSALHAGIKEAVSPFAEDGKLLGAWFESARLMRTGMAAATPEQREWLERAIWRNRVDAEGFARRFVKRFDKSRRLSLGPRETARVNDTLIPRLTHIFEGIDFARRVRTPEAAQAAVIARWKERIFELRDVKFASWNDFIKMIVTDPRFDSYHDITDHLALNIYGMTYFWTGGDRRAQLDFLNAISALPENGGLSVEEAFRRYSRPARPKSSAPSAPGASFAATAPGLPGFRVSATAEDARHLRAAVGRIAGEWLDRLSALSPLQKRLWRAKLARRAVIVRGDGPAFRAYWRMHLRGFFGLNLGLFAMRVSFFGRDFRFALWPVVLCAMFSHYGFTPETLRAFLVFFFFPVRIFLGAGAVFLKKWQTQAAVALYLKGKAFPVGPSLFGGSLHQLLWPVAGLASVLLFGPSIAAFGAWFLAYLLPFKLYQLWGTARQAREELERDRRDGALDSAPIDGQHIVLDAERTELFADHPAAIWLSPDRVREIVAEHELIHQMGLAGLSGLDTFQSNVLANALTFWRVGAKPEGVRRLFFEADALRAFPPAPRDLTGRHRRRISDHPAVREALEAPTLGHAFHVLQRDLPADHPLALDVARFKKALAEGWLPSSPLGLWEHTFPVHFIAVYFASRATSADDLAAAARSLGAGVFDYAPAADEAEVARLLAALDSEDYGEWHAAGLALAALGRRAGLSERDRAAACDRLSSLWQFRELPADRRSDAAAVYASVDPERMADEIVLLAGWFVGEDEAAPSAKDMAKLLADFAAAVRAGRIPSSLNARLFDALDALLLHESAAVRGAARNVLAAADASRLFDRLTKAFLGDASFDEPLLPLEHMDALAREMKIANLPGWSRIRDVVESYAEEGEGRESRLAKRILKNVAGESKRGRRGGLDGPSIYGVTAWKPVLERWLGSSAGLPATRRLWSDLLKAHGLSGVAEGDLAALAAALEAAGRAFIPPYAQAARLLDAVSASAGGPSKVVAAGKNNPYQAEFRRAVRAVREVHGLPLSLQQVHYIRGPPLGVLATWTRDGHFLVHASVVERWRREGRDVAKCLAQTILHESMERFETETAERAGRRTSRAWLIDLHRRVSGHFSLDRLKTARVSDISELEDGPHFETPARDGGYVNFEEANEVWRRAKELMDLGASPRDIAIACPTPYPAQLRLIRSVFARARTPLPDTLLFTDAPVSDGKHKFLIVTTVRSNAGLIEGLRHMAKNHLIQWLYHAEKSEHPEKLRLVFRRASEDPTEPAVRVWQSKRGDYYIRRTVWNRPGERVRTLRIDRFSFIDNLRILKGRAGWQKLTPAEVEEFSAPYRIDPVDFAGLDRLLASGPQPILVGNLATLQQNPGVARLLRPMLEPYEPPADGAKVEAVLARIARAAAAGERPVVVMDLDGTAVDNVTRVLHRVKSFAEGADVPEAAREFFRALTIDDIPAGVSTTEFVSRHVELTPELRRVWDYDFAWHKFVRFDRATPGAAEFLRRAHAAGAHIVYLTGRPDRSPVREVTEAQIREKGFPNLEDDLRVTLMMKDPAVEDDAEYKAERSREVAALGKVVAAFDDLHKNAQRLREVFPDAEVFRVTGGQPALSSEHPKHTLADFLTVRELPFGPREIPAAAELAAWAGPEALAEALEAFRLAVPDSALTRIALARGPPAETAAGLDALVRVDEHGAVFLRPELPGLWAARGFDPRALVFIALLRMDLQYRRRMERPAAPDTVVGVAEQSAWDAEADGRGLSLDLPAALISLPFLLDAYLEARRLPSELVPAAEVRRLLSRLRKNHAYSAFHSGHVARGARDTAAALGYSRAQILFAAQAALLHDIGKHRVDAALLNGKKPQPTPREMKSLQSHAAKGLSELKQLYPNSFAWAGTLHHRRMDGKGYPKVRLDGRSRELKGTDVPPIARLIAVVDGFDAMVADRGYNVPMTPAQAFERLEGDAAHFDAFFVKAYKPVAPAGKPALGLALAGDAPYMKVLLVPAEGEGAALARRPSSWPGVSPAMRAALSAAWRRAAAALPPEQRRLLRGLQLMQGSPNVAHANVADAAVEIDAGLLSAVEEWGGGLSEETRAAEIETVLHWALVHEMNHLRVSGTGAFVEEAVVALLDGIRPAGERRAIRSFLDFLAARGAETNGYEQIFGPRSGGAEQARAAMRYAARVAGPSGDATEQDVLRALALFGDGNGTWDAAAPFVFSALDDVAGEEAARLRETEGPRAGRLFRRLQAFAREVRVRLMRRVFSPETEELKARLAAALGRALVFDAAGARRLQHPNPFREGIFFLTAESGSGKAAETVQFVVFTQPGPIFKAGRIVKAAARVGEMGREDFLAGKEFRWLSEEETERLRPLFRANLRVVPVRAMKGLHFLGRRGESRPVGLFLENSLAQDRLLLSDPLTRHFSMAMELEDMRRDDGALWVRAQPSTVGGYFMRSARRVLGRYPEAPLDVAGHMMNLGVHVHEMIHYVFDAWTRSHGGNMLYQTNYLLLAKKFAGPLYAPLRASVSVILPGAVPAEADVHDEMNSRLLSAVFAYRTTTEFGTPVYLDTIETYRTLGLLPDWLDPAQMFSVERSLYAEPDGALKPAFYGFALWGHLLSADDDDIARHRFPTDVTAALAAARIHLPAHRRARADAILPVLEKRAYVRPVVEVRFVPGKRGAAKGAGRRLHVEQAAVYAGGFAAAGAAAFLSVTAGVPFAAALAFGGGALWAALGTWLVRAAGIEAMNAGDLSSEGLRGLLVELLDGTVPSAGAPASLQAMRNRLEDILSRQERVAVRLRTTDEMEKEFGDRGTVARAEGGRIYLNVGWLAQGGNARRLSVLPSVLAHERTHISGWRPRTPWRALNEFFRRGIFRSELSAYLRTALEMFRRAGPYRVRLEIEEEPTAARGLAWNARHMAEALKDARAETAVKEAVSVASKELASPLETGRRVVGVGDVHGDLAGLLVNLMTAGLVDENGAWSGGRATLVQIGDVIDRGPYTFQTYLYLRRLQRQARRAGGDVVILLGNHEQMLLEDNWQEILKNPGYDVNNQRAYIDLKKDIIAAILEGNIVAAYEAGGQVFVHSGVVPAFAEGRAPRAFVEDVNRRLQAAASIKNFSLDPMFGADGLFWLRPPRLAAEGVPFDLVVGHIWTDSGFVEIMDGKIARIDVNDMNLKRRGYAVLEGDRLTGIALLGKPPAVPAEAPGERADARLRALRYLTEEEAAGRIDGVLSAARGELAGGLSGSSVDGFSEGFAALAAVHGYGAALGGGTADAEIASALELFYGRAFEALPPVRTDLLDRFEAAAGGRQNEFSAEALRFAELIRLFGSPEAARKRALSAPEARAEDYRRLEEAYGRGWTLGRWAAESRARRGDVRRDALVRRWESAAPGDGLVKSFDVTGLLQAAAEDRRPSPREIGLLDALVRELEEGMNSDAPRPIALLSGVPDALAVQKLETFLPDELKPGLRRAALFSGLEVRSLFDKRLDPDRLVASLEKRFGTGARTEVFTEDASRWKDDWRSAAKALLIEIVNEAEFRVFRSLGDLERELQNERVLKIQA